METNGFYGMNTENNKKETNSREQRKKTEKIINEAGSIYDILIKSDNEWQMEYRLIYNSYRIDLFGN